MYPFFFRTGKKAGSERIKKEHMSLAEGPLNSLGSSSSNSTFHVFVAEKKICHTIMMSSCEVEKTDNFRPYKAKKLVSHGRQETSTNGLAASTFWNQGQQKAV